MFLSVPALAHKLPSFPRSLSAAPAPVAAPSAPPRSKMMASLRLTTQAAAYVRSQPSSLRRSMVIVRATADAKKPEAKITKGELVRLQGPRPDPGRPGPCPCLQAAGRALSYQPLGSSGCQAGWGARGRGTTSLRVRAPAAPARSAPQKSTLPTPSPFAATPPPSRRTWSRARLASPWRCVRPLAPACMRCPRRAAEPECTARMDRRFCPPALCHVI